jgi:hypothetical protein
MPFGLPPLRIGLAASALRAAATTVAANRVARDEPKGESREQRLEWNAAPGFWLRLNPGYGRSSRD